MSENNTDTLKGYLIILALIFILFLFAVVFVILFSDFGFVNPKGLEVKERIDYLTKSLTTIGTIFGGLAVLINAYYAAKRWEAMDKSALAANESAKAALKNAEAALKNAQVAEDKQITERFAKAIEQLGSDKIEVRLGAIYTLERIVKDSLKDHWTIMEVLTAFVRENAPLKDFSEKNTVNTESLIIVDSWNYQKPKEIEEEPKLRTDIQAALTVIGRRNTDTEQENQKLDLRNIDIKGANLKEANLQNANLMGANLQKVILFKAKLQKVHLYKANLQGANLLQANLQGAFLEKANLQEAFLSRANLQTANLKEANLQKANFWGANLQRATLAKAELQEAVLMVAELKGANLKEAKNLKLLQIKSAKGDRTTILPENLQRPEHWQ